MEGKQLLIYLLLRLFTINTQLVVPYCIYVGFSATETRKEKNVKIKKKLFK